MSLRNCYIECRLPDNLWKNLTFNIGHLATLNVTKEKLHSSLNYRKHLKAVNTDMLLWTTFQKGDRDAFARIYSLYIDELLSYGYRVTSNRQLIRDSIQDLFLHLWLHKENLSETDSVKFYLFRALRNRITRNIEKDLGIHTEDSGNLLESALGELPFEHDLVQKETEEAQVRRLHTAIGQLPKRQQEVIVFRYHHDFSLEEISRLMNLNNQSVRNLLHRSISQLRSIFEVAGWTFLLLLGFEKII